MPNIVKSKAAELTVRHVTDFYKLTEALVPEYEGDLMWILGWSHRVQNQHGQLGPCLLTDNFSMSSRDWDAKVALNLYEDVEQSIKKISAFVDAPEFEQALAMAKCLNAEASPADIKQQILRLLPGRPASRGASEMYTTMVIELLMSDSYPSLGAVIEGVFAARRGDDIEGFAGKRSMDTLQFLPSEALVYQYVKAAEKKLQSRVQPILLMKRRLQQLIDAKVEMDKQHQEYLASNEYKRLKKERHEYHASDEYKRRKEAFERCRPVEPATSLLPMVSEEILAEENAKSARRRADASLVAKGTRTGTAWIAIISYGRNAWPR